MFNSSTCSRLSRAFTRLGSLHALRLASPNVIARTNAGRGSSLGKRRIATSTETTSKKPCDDFHELLTLNPKQLSMAGQQPVDLSGKIDITTHSLLNQSLQKCQYYQEVDNEPQRFPENTKGFFYYYHSFDEPELSAGVRFRICDSLAQFEHGQDLLDPIGDVWGYKLPELVKHSPQNGFLSLLRHENLVPEELIDDINKLDMPNNVKRYYYSLSDPFVLDVAKPPKKLMFATRAKVIELDLLHTPFADASKGSVVYPLTGSIRVQFQLSHYIEHIKLGPTLVLRVLNIVKPIARSPLYKGKTIIFPMQGSLLIRMTKQKKTRTRIPLKHQRMANDLLELMKISGLKSSLKAKGSSKVEGSSP